MDYAACSAANWPHGLDLSPGYMPPKGSSGGCQVGYDMWTPHAARHLHCAQRADKTATFAAGRRRAFRRVIKTGRLVRFRLQVSRIQHGT